MTMDQEKFEKACQAAVKNRSENPLFDYTTLLDDCGQLVKVYLDDGHTERVF